MAEATAVQVTRGEVVNLFTLLQFQDPQKWAPLRLEKKIKALPDLVDEKTAKSVGENDADALKLLKRLIKTVKSGGEVSINETSDEDAQDAASSDDDADTVEMSTEDAGGDDGASGASETEAKPKKKGGRPKGSKNKSKDGETKKEKPPKEKKVSMLDAAEKVLEGNDGEPMKTAQIVLEMDDQGLWSSPSGKTPEATLYVRMLKEERTKGRQSRFKRVGPGLFGLMKNHKDEDDYEPTPRGKKSSKEDSENEDSDD